MNDTKKHIIIEAAKLFLQKNFKEVTTREIVTATGLSKGAFYHYFESKEQLFKEVLTYISTIVYAFNYDKYNPNSFYGFYHDYAKEVISNTEHFFSLIKLDNNEPQLFINFFTLYFDAIKLFPDFEDLTVSLLKNELDVWKNAIKKARERGEIKTKMSDEHLAKLFIHLNDGISLHKVFIGKWSVESIFESVLELWDEIYDLIKA